MTGKEVVKSVSLNTPLGMIFRKLLETHDTTSTAKFNLMEKNSFKNQTPCSGVGRGGNKLSLTDDAKPGNRDRPRGH
jgi:hypothetical protein